MTLTIKDIPHISFTLTAPCATWSICDIAEETYDIFDMDVYLPSKGINLQRELCWLLYQKQEFILAILADKEIPSMSINTRRGSDRCEVIDGKQRISTAVSFYNNEFPIEINGVEYYYRDFDEELAGIFAHYSFTAYFHFEHDRCPETILSDEEKIRWFLYINNSGVPQNAEYINTLSELLK